MDGGGEVDKYDRLSVRSGVPGIRKQVVDVSGSLGSSAYSSDLISDRSVRRAEGRDFAFSGPCAALSCVWWPILLSGEVDTAHHTNYLCSEHMAFMLHLENAHVFSRLSL